MAGYRFQPQRQRLVLSHRPDVRGGEDLREIEMTRRETTSPERMRECDVGYPPLSAIIGGAQHVNTSIDT